MPSDDRAPQRPARPEHDIIVLAGGRGSRLGGMDKAALEVAGRRLLDRVLDSAAAARRVVVVGPVAVVEPVLQTVEEPPGGGPVAGIAAGMMTLGALPGTVAWTLVLAVDQPQAAAAVPDLLEAAAHAGSHVEMVCPQDTTGHPQWLLAAYRTTALVSALDRVGTGHGTSVRRLVADLSWAPASAAHVGDIDTWEDHAAWQARLE
ncbi:molybdenum cofactor guanylyltransferase [Ornithinimicrobium cryptoxanthini]|uniref:NTP transferase domain-containing protein n=1 Tax=Ornithinimicrobium cryptoxanthini TaxID=2934161 RepID=A0ABY4YMV6_9MICO|nr:NTP transferase domain-containing protein [Ornithinimicrobium cryptoxanthini]USQ77929.1 NTP transferase domain-containing protein [Ornithinimicrobium cryptoxanthini]